MKRDLRATWSQAILALAIPLVLLMTSRWLLIEPYVIPSGSMIPTLLVHDHIMVNKLAYGLRLPFSSKWLVRWGQVRPGDIIVFRYPENPDVYFVKRVLATGGQKFELREGRVYRDGVLVPNEVHAAPENFEPGYTYATEENHWIRYRDREGANFREVTVPEGHLMVIGDNRDESHDSRGWGFLPLENVLGRASLIWLSCDATLPTAPMICDPQQIRWDRLLTFVNQPVTLLK